MDIPLTRKRTQRSLSFPLILKKTRNKQGWDFVKVDSLPDFLNDNEYLLANHRPQLKSLAECFRSVFMIHTETFNVWTHVFGAVMALCLLINHLINSNAKWQQNIYFVLFFLGAATCMTISALFHTVLCHSEKTFKLFAKLDYCGVIFLCSSTYYLWFHLGFYCVLAVQLFYMILSATLAGVCLLVVLQDRFSNPKYTIFRAGLFVSLGLTSTVPGVHFIIMEQSSGLPSASISWLLVSGVFYLLGAFAYALKLPERLWPGKCDIFIQGHQILHIAVVFGFLLCYKGAIVLADERNSQTCDA